MYICMIKHTGDDAHTYTYALIPWSNRVIYYIYTYIYIYIHIYTYIYIYIHILHIHIYDKTHK